MLKRSAENMRDAINPMRAEIREWAFTKEPSEPEQDWDLHLANLREFDLYVELAADNSCPNRDYFLCVLYLVVGDAVRTEFRTESEETVNEVLAMTREYPRHRFHLLRTRAETLLRNPESFSYDDWCAGGLVAPDRSSSS